MDRKDSGDLKGCQVLLNRTFCPLQSFSGAEWSPHHSVFGGCLVHGGEYLPVAYIFLCLPSVVLLGLKGLQKKAQNSRGAGSKVLPTTQLCGSLTFCKPHLKRLQFLSVGFGGLCSAPTGSVHEQPTQLNHKPNCIFPVDVHL